MSLQHKGLAVASNLLLSTFNHVACKMSCLIVFALGMNIVNSPCLSHRLHSERQSSSVCYRYLSACHDSQGEARHCDAVLSPLWKFPKQRQVLKLSDFLIVLLWKDVWGVNGCPCSSLCNSRLSEGSETDSDASKVNSRSEELLPTPTSSTSTDSSFGDGM